MTTTLIDYQDIYTAVAEALKVPVTDTVTIGRIKRDINTIYLNEVVPFNPRAWWWLYQETTITTTTKVITGTVTLTEDSTTLTFSDAPAVSVAGYYIKVSGHPEVIKISAHTATQTGATLADAWPLADVTAGSFKAWKDYAAIPSTMKEVVQVTHSRLRMPLEAVHLSAFDERRIQFPEREGYPLLFNCADFDASDDRLLKWYPSCYDKKIILRVEGRQEAVALSADADEPLMPVEDRAVLFYGAMHMAWARERNESESNRNYNLMMAKLMQMAGKGGAAPETTEIRVSENYTVNKRYRRNYRRGYGRWENSD